MNAIVPLPSKNILVGGDFAHVDGLPRPALVRLYGGDAVLYGPTRRGTELELSVPSSPGVSYIVEFAGSLSEPNWTVLTSFRGDGATRQVIDSFAGSAQRFYRVRVQ